MAKVRTRRDRRSSGYSYRSRRCWYCSSRLVGHLGKPSEPVAQKVAQALYASGLIPAGVALIFLRNAPKESPGNGEMPGLRAGSRGWGDRIRPP